MDTILQKVSEDYGSFTIYLFDISNFNLVDENNNVIIYSELADKTYKIKNDKDIELYNGEINTYMFNDFFKEDGVKFFNKHINLDAIKVNHLYIIQSIINIHKNQSTFGFGKECKKFIDQL